jgi:hypothetical protein
VPLVVGRVYAMASKACSEKNGAGRGGPAGDVEINNLPYND